MLTFRAGGPLLETKETQGLCQYIVRSLVLWIAGEEGAIPGSETLMCLI